MGLISDSNGKPMTTEEKTEETPSGNGQSHGKEIQDVRSLPTGTIIYNLIRVTGEEVGIEAFIHQMEAAKAALKMVVDQPQLVRAKEVHTQMCHHRFILANEINERFKDLDEARATACGIKVFVPNDGGPGAGSPAETPSAESEQEA